MRAHRRRGFTLVELMITIAVIGILGLVVTPGILKTIPKYRVDRAAKALATEMNLARMRAIAKNKTHHVVFDAGTAQTITVYEDDDNNWSTANTVVKTISLATEFPNVKLDYNSVTGVDGSTLTSAVTFPNSRATFLPNGLLTQPGAFYLMPSGDKGVRNDRLRAVEVTRAGQVVLYRYDTASSSWEEM
ncbi:GspH/FimT family pseudopilin [Deferrisoma palaeochoriense]